MGTLPNNESVYLAYDKIKGMLNHFESMKIERVNKMQYMVHSPRKLLHDIEDAKALLKDWIEEQREDKQVDNKKFALIRDKLRVARPELRNYLRKPLSWAERISVGTPILHAIEDALDIAEEGVKDGEDGA